MSLSKQSWPGQRSGGSGYSPQMPRDQYRHSPLFENRDGVMSFNGDPEYVEEWESRTRLAFDSILDTDSAKQDMMRRAILPKMVKGLYGRAWRKCRNVDKLKSSELTDPESAPENSLELLILTVKLKT